MTATDLQSVPDTARFTSASLLQRLLPELVALALDVKQAHWNVTGPGFLPLHALTDEIAADARSWGDAVAERALALGFSVDARPRTVAAVASDFPAGHVQDHEAVAELIAVIDGVTATALRLVADLERTDAVAHTLTLDVVEGLERHRWKLRAQVSGRFPFPAHDGPGPVPGP
ncbi:MAG TPA: DNA starvation/stationary phase protection protein [Acidimicrobiales bacterium]|nr:DNA starvation/stationary phase protection protein [Acidimicrobiales bacterium]